MRQLYTKGVFHMESKMKEMTIDNLDLIAEGGMGKIYRINDEQILKVFNSISLEELQKQKAATVEVFKAMVPTPISFELVKAGDKYGIIYEFLDSTSAGKALADHPERINEIGEKMGLLLRDMHQASMENRVLEYMNDRASSWVDRIENKFIKEKDTRMLREIIKAIPRGHCLLHCDFHEGNVMIHNGEYLLIDIDEVCIGHPLYDLTYHYINHEFLAKQKKLMIRAVHNPERSYPYLSDRQYIHADGPFRSGSGCHSGKPGADRAGPAPSF